MKRKRSVSRLVRFPFSSLAVGKRTYSLSLRLGLLKIRLLGSKSSVETGDDGGLDGFGSFLLGLESMQRSENFLPTVELILDIRISLTLLSVPELSLDLKREEEEEESQLMTERPREEK